MFAKRRYDNPRTPRKNGSQRTPRKQALRGLFKDTVWYCDCDCSPRLPANQFTVKKPGPNKGRRFLTCQQEEEKRCGFFIWGDEAEQREASAVLSNSRSEPRKPEMPGILTQSAMTPVTEKTIKFVDLDTSDSEPEPSPSRRKTENKLKRTAEMAELDEEDDFDKGFPIAEMELQYSQTMSPATPNKRQALSYPTPDTKLELKKSTIPWLQQEEATSPSKDRIEELMTPSKPPRPTDTSTSTPSAPTTPERPIDAAAASPPKVNRFTDALADPDVDDSPLATEVLAELVGCNIPDATLSKLRGILTRYELRAEGVKKGREMSRLALEKQKVVHGRLQTKIQSLESQLQVAKAVRTANKAAQLRR